MKQIELNFRKIRETVSADDASPLITESYADLSAGTKAKFKRVNGKTPVLIFKFGGTGTKTATIRCFYIDEYTDFNTEGNPKGSVLSWGASSNITTATTRLEIANPVGSLMFVAVTNLPSNTTLDIFVADSYDE